MEPVLACAGEGEGEGETRLLPCSAQSLPRLEENEGDEGPCASGQPTPPESLCRFCYADEGNDLISPCRCRGTQKYIHRSCLDSWRATKGWFALTHCSTCKSPFHLRLPPSTPGRFLLSLGLRGGMAALVFSLLQLVPLGLGFLATRDAVHTSLHSLCSRSWLHCYCAGVWELTADILFAMGLGLEHWAWRWSLCATIVILKYAAVLPAVARLVSFCHQRMHLLPPTFPAALLPQCPSQWWERVEGALAVGSCGAHGVGVILTVAVGVVASLLVVVQAIRSVGVLGRSSRTVLVKELEVLDIPGNYSPPNFSRSQKRRLQALKLLA